MVGGARVVMPASRCADGGDASPRTSRHRGRGSTPRQTINRIRYNQPFLMPPLFTACPTRRRAACGRWHGGGTWVPRLLTRCAHTLGQPVQPRVSAAHATPIMGWSMDGLVARCTVSSQIHRIRYNQEPSMRSRKRASLSRSACCWSARAAAKAACCWRSAASSARSGSGALSASCMVSLSTSRPPEMG